MRKIYALCLSMMLLSYACTKEEVTSGYETVEVAVQLLYPADAEQAAGVKINARSTAGMGYEAATDADGKATFKLPVGIYEVSATDKRNTNGKSIVYSGSQSNLAVTTGNNAPVRLTMIESVINQIVIKELYSGGCQKNDGSGAYYYDKYVVLYNNSNDDAQLQHMCLAMALPYNATVNNSDMQNGSLFYEAEGWIPAGLGYFYFPNSTVLKPGEQIVVAFNNANDNTNTYSNSIDLSNSEYYVTYAPEAFTNTSYHPAPSANIPTNHYLPGFKYGTGNAWPLSNTSPAFFLFVPENMTPDEFAADASNISLYGGSASQVRKKVPVEWVIDGMEIFKYGAANNSKRLTPAVDGGAVELNSTFGYSIYRNVDKSATEAIAANAGKIVYNYALGTTAQNGSTDPSGIDAEASIRLGARIIYADTNHSGNDFHQRAHASLKD